MRRVTAFLTAFVVAALVGGAAHAKYSLCNKTSYVLSAAIAYVDGDRLATRGWWRLRPGECKVVLTEPTDPGRYFVYAEGIPGHLGPTRAWSGDTPLCVENAGFFNLRNQDVCKEDPSRQRSFFAVDVTAAAKGSWQTDFAEAANYSVFSAEVAGVQRLLGDVGASDPAVDGSLGRNTQRALAAYKKKKGLGAGATIDDTVVDALIEEANAAEAKRGLFLCNKADAPVWSAIATPNASGDDKSDDFEARGWWRVAPGDCAKVVKGELTSERYYVYGLIEEANGDRTLIDGERAFCVNDVKFQTTTETTCADQDLDEASFRKVEVGGETSFTYEFTIADFADAPAAGN
ncbi:MAG: DUF1036 domain-containing protein [Parvularculaceae bacterium]